MTVRSPEPVARTSPSERIVYSVAEQTNTDPLVLPPLYETIDADVLDRIVSSMESGEFQFQYAGQTVSIHSDGAVHVTE